VLLRKRTYTAFREKARFNRGFGVLSGRTAGHAGASVNVIRKKLTGAGEQNYLRFVK